LLSIDLLGAVVGCLLLRPGFRFVTRVRVRFRIRLGPRPRFAPSLPPGLPLLRIVLGKVCIESLAEHIGERNAGPAPRDQALRPLQPIQKALISPKGDVEQQVRRARARIGTYPVISRSTGTVIRGRPVGSVSLALFLIESGRCCPSGVSASGNVRVRSTRCSRSRTHVRLGTRSRLRC
jgi:hypothetical protein